MNKGQKFSAGYFLLTLLVVWLFGDLVYKPYIASQTEVQYSTFLSDLDGGRIADVSLKDDRVVYSLKPEDAGGSRRASPAIRSAVRVPDVLLVERLASADVAFGGVAQTQTLLDTLFSILLPFLPLALIWYFIFRRMQGGGSVMSLGRSKAQELQGEMTGVRFADVGGVGEAEVLLRR